MPNKAIKEVQGLETQFKNWCKRSGNSIGTAETYWDRIRDFKHFRLKDNGEREISGSLNKQLSTSEQKTAVNQYLEFLFEEYERDEVSDTGYEDLRYKKNAIKSNLEVPKKERNRDKDVDVKRHYLHKDELVALLHESEPVRAKLYLLLYSGGFRIGEIKRLTHAHIREKYGEHGAIKIPTSRTKSGKERTVKFRSEIPLQILEDAPTGTWEDENGEKWDNVFFPENYTQLENYYLEKYCEAIGVEKRSSHTFRHIRITDLIQASNLPLEKVQIRSGHELGSAATKVYTEASFDREPETLETYLDNNSVNIEEIIKR